MGGSRDSGFWLMRISRSGNNKNVSSRWWHGPAWPCRDASPPRGQCPGHRSRHGTRTGKPWTWLPSASVTVPMHKGRVPARQTNARRWPAFPRRSLRRHPAPRAAAPARRHGARQRVQPVARGGLGVGDARGLALGELVFSGIPEQRGRRPRPPAPARWPADRQSAGRRQCLAGRALAQAGGLVVALAQRCELPVAAARADQRDTERQPVGADGAGHRDGVVVEQIDRSWCIHPGCGRAPPGPPAWRQWCSAVARQLHVLPQHRCLLAQRPAPPPGRPRR